MSSDPRPPVHASVPRYAQVLIPRHIAKSFTYVIPPDLAGEVTEGQRVLVPFGRATVEGAVLSVAHVPPSDVHPGRLKEIRGVSDQGGNGKVTEVLFALTRRVSDEYVAPWGQCLRLIHQPLRKAAAAVRYVATEGGRTALHDGRCPEQYRPLLARVAGRAAGISSRTLLARQPGNAALLESLSSKGWIAAANKGEAGGRARSTRAAQVEAALGLPTQERGLISPDPAWIARLTDALAGPRPTTLLVQAPWQERVSLLAATLDLLVRRKQSAIMVCGEVAKAQWLGHLLRSVAHLPIHIRSLNEAAGAPPADVEGAPALLVGTRSAVFAPLPNVGLIWVDGEDDPALKEPQEPRYHGREVARMRAELEGALLVLASAHPSMESYAALYQEHRLARRPDTALAVEVVDLGAEPSGAVFSTTLISAMEAAVAAKAGILLFLNRKGYAGALACRDCGAVPRCPSCAVACSYSRASARLTCRYCGFGLPLPEVCGHCGAARLHPVGEGTERVELEARRLFPRAVILRLDGDTTRRPRDAERLWDQLYRRDFDLVIGTQLLFQRAPLPPMGLVGIVQADTALHVPDFRAAERTYQHMMEAAETARFFPGGGRVCIQTRLPDHYAIQAVAQGEPEQFYREELAARELLGYPPVCALASLAVSGRAAEIVQQAAMQWRTALEQRLRAVQSTILGPVPSFGGKARGHHRHTMLVKTADGAIQRAAIRQSAEEMECRYRKSQAKFIVDVDPVEMI